MSWLESELQEQPAALARLIDRQAERAREIAGILGRDDVQYILIASRGSSSNAQTRLPLVPRVPEWFSPLTAVVPGQLMALRFAQLRGLDLPAGLSKVTLTR